MLVNIHLEPKKGIVISKTRLTIQKARFGSGKHSTTVGTISPNLTMKLLKMVWHKAK